ncbi:MAG: stage III sporulation protein AB, partial [Eubacteriales bacterium]
GEREKRRLSECEAFLDLFEYVKNQIHFFLTPTKEIYRGYENDTLEKCGFLAELRSHENDEVYEDIWRISFEKIKSKLSLSDKQRSIIKSFGDYIGKTSGKIQTNSFDYCIGELTSEINRQRMETEKNIKLYRTLGIAAGACAAILII